MLTETGVNTGVFTGSIMTVSAPAVVLNDGTIQVTSATTVTASYIDGIDANLLRNQARTDSVANAAPMMALTKAVSHDSAPPGSEIIYSIAFRNAGAAAAHTVVIMDAVPAFTRYVPGSMRLGLANSSYDAAAVLTDVADADAGTLNGTLIMFLIHSVAANDGVDLSGTDEGKVFFKVVIE
ncbi:hypothetical protein [Oligosphaera ethanolica]|uniref:Repeat protein (TIGR01451 family) n=1 Tax=Oligosphaera ethanolica TaxID=760260 RepID=A0AAE3VK59_9BACT|nr:hypothetical protein [Oligosphaera ethanolica]MDQ0291683.1 putative repeat protein (TIGR01451 family) [Oligosphaera ethanolica]